MTIELGPEVYRAPLTAAQQAVFFAAQLAPQPLYTIAFGLVFESSLDPAAVNSALEQLVRRHHVLRTTFTLDGDQPVQVVREVQKVDVEWTGIPITGRDEDAAVSARLRRQLEEPFDLDGASAPVRVGGVRLAGGGAALLVTVHHLCFDGGSIPVFVEELVDGLEGGARDLPELQYADVAEWQQDRLADGSWDGSRDYWRERLSGLENGGSPPAMAGATVGHEGGTVEVTLPHEISVALDQLARSHGTSRFTVLAAAMLVLLHRYTGHEDLAVGMPVAQHERLAQTREMIGLLLNTVVLRTRVDPNATFGSLLSEVRGEVLRALDHQDYPVDLIARELGQGRALFDVLLNYERAERGVWRSATGPVRLLGCEEHEAKFPMTLYIADGPVCTLRAAFQTGRFAHEQMLAVLEQYVELLRQVTGDDHRRIDDYSLLSGVSTAVLADPAAPLPRTATVSVVDRFLAAVSADPDAVAVTEGEREWSYAALERETRLVAEALQAKGIGPSDVVAVSGERGFGFIRAMLGVLRSGAVFQPVDADLPEARKRQLLNDSAAKLVIDGCGEPFAVPAVPPPLPDRFEPDQPCYLFFTSGTTGTPKPVVGVHAGLAHFIAWQAKRFAVGPGDRVAQLTSAGFDPFLRDVLLPLTTGATLCLPPRDLRSGDPAVLAWLAEQQITMLHAVPSLAKWWLAAPGSPDLSRLRWVFFAGEPLTGALIGQWRARFPGSGRIVNLYGPTETTQAMCYHVVPDRVPPGVQPIGVSIPDTQALVLSASGRRCAAGEVGEICVRSPFRSTARDPRTGELLGGFVTNPFRDGDPADLIYRSGDLGRFRLDGTLEILGRRDHQIKVNGVRIDPNEIAATLAGHASVADCVVHQWREDDGTTLLAAYVTACGTGVPSARELRRWAGEKLPRVMVPAAIVVLDRLPVTVNGKVDRRALPRPDAGTPVQGRSPVTAEEERVCAHLAELLGRPLVYADDDFFALGGHSLIMTQLIVRLESEFGVRLGFDEVFRRPVAGEIAALLARKKSVPAAQPAVRARVGVSFAGLDDDEMDVLLAALRGDERG